MLDEAEKNLHRRFVWINFLGCVRNSRPESNRIFSNSLALLREVQFERGIGDNEIKMPDRAISISMSWSKQCIALNHILNGVCKVIENEVQAKHLRRFLRNILRKNGAAVFADLVSKSHKERS